MAIAPLLMVGMLTFWRIGPSGLAVGGIRERKSQVRESGA
jgi:hypothetical protein